MKIAKTVDWFSGPSLRLGVGLVAACASCDASRFGAVEESEAAGHAGRVSQLVGGAFGKAGGPSAGGSSSRGGQGGEPNGVAGAPVKPCESGVRESCHAETCNGIRLCSDGAWGACECATPATGGTGGSLGELGGGGGAETGGTAGTGGASCVPLHRDAACNAAICGDQDDGCGGTILCGQCNPNQDCLDGWCVVKQGCDCPAGYCGKLLSCSTFTWCGGCGNDVCAAQEDGSKACELALSGEHNCSPVQGLTCCGGQCFRAFYGASCSPGETLNPADGSECGTCEQDGVVHYCHAP